MTLMTHMKWFTADPHFFHKNIIGHTGRPFADVKQMNKVLKDNWNEVVDEDDTIYVLGDLSSWYDIDISQLARLIRKLNGEKILVLGNHDKFNAFDYVDMGFKTVHTHVYLEDIGLHLTHDPGNCKLLPTQHWLCGHVHGLFHINENVFNVGVDVNDYTPVSESEIIEWMSDD